MKKISLVSLRGENFKGIDYVNISFTKMNIIKGANATGKTSLLDLFRWVLFGKDSQGRTDFQIRPVNEYGEMVNNVEILGEVALDVDGDIITFTKKQSQVWTKKRGESAPTFSGNKNEMWINEFPTSQKDYEAKVSEILNESLFKLMTDPMEFSRLPWKEQREILLRFVSEITDKDILELNEAGFASIADDILYAGAEAVRDKAFATLKKLKEEQKTYPVRIDEAMRNKAPVLSEEEVLDRKAKAEEDLDAIRKEMDDLNASLQYLTDIQDEIVKTKLAMGEIRSKADAYTMQMKADARIAITDETTKIAVLEQRRDKLEGSLSEITKSIADDEAEIAELSRQYREIKSRVMPEDETVCPTCGREFDPDRIAEITAEFEKRKARDLGRIENKGRTCRSRIDAEKKRMETIHPEIEKINAEIDELNDALKVLRGKANRIQPIDYTERPEYKALEDRLAELNRKLETADDGAERRGALRGRENAARDALMMANGDLSVIESNKRLDARIEELKAEQRDCGQKIADAEEALFLIEGFIKLKMDTLSDRINSHFKKVRFRLFKNLINGAVQPTCVMQMASNGSYVDYPNLNHGGQIIAGLDVIEALGDLYDVSAPVFVDNAECLDDKNTPRECNSQLILLKVSQDERLVACPSL